MLDYRNVTTCVPAVVLRGDVAFVRTVGFGSGDKRGPLTWTACSPGSIKAHSAGKTVQPRRIPRCLLIALVNGGDSITVEPARRRRPHDRMATGPKVF